MKIAVLVGSLRRESWTRKVANALIELAPKSLSFEHVEIGALPNYNQDLDPDHSPAEWVTFRNLVRPVDGVLFATPEYNRSVPGLLKNAIDVGSRPFGKSVWQSKPAGIVSVTPGAYGAFGANHALRQSLVFLDMPAMQQPEAYINQVASVFDADGKVTNEKSRELFTKFMASFASWVERHRHK